MAVPAHAPTAAAPRRRLVPLLHATPRTLPGRRAAVCRAMGDAAVPALSHAQQVRAKVCVFVCVWGGGASCVPGRVLASTAQWAYGARSASQSCGGRPPNRLLLPHRVCVQRYVCLLAAGDSKPEVRDQGLRGLGLHPAQLAPAAAAGGSAATYRAAVAGLGLPAPGSILAYVTGKHRALASPGDLSRWVG
jgi:hypothetical protein